MYQKSFLSFQGTKWPEVLRPMAIPRCFCITFLTSNTVKITKGYRKNLLSLWHLGFCHPLLFVCNWGRNSWTKSNLKKYIYFFLHNNFSLYYSTRFSTCLVPGTAFLWSALLQDRGNQTAISFQQEMTVFQIEIQWK